MEKQTHRMHTNTGDTEKKTITINTNREDVYWKVQYIYTYIQISLVLLLTSMQVIIMIKEK